MYHAPQPSTVNYQQDLRPVSSFYGEPKVPRNPGSHGYESPPRRLSHLAANSYSPRASGYYSSIYQDDAGLLDSADAKDIYVRGGARIV